MRTAPTKFLTLAVATAAIVSTFTNVSTTQAAVAPAAPDAPQPLPALDGRPDVVGQEMLGGTFQSPMAGIAFRTPINCVQVKASADQIARFANEKGGWEIICTRNSSNDPMPLLGGGQDGPKL